LVARHVSHKDGNPIPQDDYEEKEAIGGQTETKKKLPSVRDPAWRWRDPANLPSS